MTRMPGGMETLSKERRSGELDSLTPVPPIWEVVTELGARIPDEEWALVPDDASINYRHYLYGSPKRTT